MDPHGPMDRNAQQPHVIRKILGSIPDIMSKKKPELPSLSIFDISVY